MAGTQPERIRLAERLPEPISHYTDAVRAGDTLWISGMLGVDRDGAVVGEGDVAAQTEQLLSNMEALLAACGAAMADVVRVGVYLRRMEDRAAVNEVRRRHFGDARPASTLVEVSALAHPEALVEIEAVAHLPQPV